MSDIAKIENLQEMIIEIRGQSVLLDSDVAKIYGVETKRVNEAVKNNSEKFPDGYLIELDKSEWEVLKSKFSTSIKGGKIRESAQKDTLMAALRSKIAIADSLDLHVDLIVKEPGKDKPIYQVVKTQGVRL